MKRVSVIGCCGAGKSTLSKELHILTNLPLVHLDKKFWSAGWMPTSRDEFQEHMAQIYESDEWIIDGHYISTMDDRMLRSDTVFHLDYSTSRCLFRTIKRMVSGFGRDRSDCAEGCPERFDLEFLRYVANFRKNFRGRTLELLAKHKHLDVITFHNPRELQTYLTNRESGRR